MFFDMSGSIGIFQNKAKGGNLSLNLRSQKTYTTRGRASNDSRGVIKGQVNIHERHEKSRRWRFRESFNRWAHYQGAVLTLVDKKVY